MTAIFKREFRSFFHGMLGYVLTAFLVASSGLYFLARCLIYGLTDFSYYTLYQTIFMLLLYIPEDSRGALAAAVELCLRLFQGEVQPDRAVRLDVAVLPGNAGPVQQQGIEDFGVVADVPQRFVLQQKPWKRHIGCRWAIGGKLTECFHLTSCPIHPIHLRIDWIDG